MSDEELVARVQAGEDAADSMAVLYTRFLPLIQKMARRYGREQDRDDLKQAGYIGLFRAAEHFRPGGAPFCAYAPYWVKREMSRCLAGISIDADCDRLDEPLPGTDTPMVELIPGPEGPDVGVVDDMTAQDCAAILWDAVRKLPAGPRAAIILRYRDGMGSAAAGTVIGADQAQIRKWLRQGLRYLRRPDVRERLLPFWKI